MQKPSAIQKCDGRMDGPTDTARWRIACPRLKMMIKTSSNNKYCPNTRFSLGKHTIMGDYATGLLLTSNWLSTDDEIA